MQINTSLMGKCVGEGRDRGGGDRAWRRPSLWGMWGELPDKVAFERGMTGSEQPHSAHTEVTSSTKSRKGESLPGVLRKQGHQCLQRSETREKRENYMSERQ